MKIKYKIILAITLILPLLLGLNTANSAAQGSSCGGIYDPHKNNPANCLGTVVSDHAWMLLRAGGKDAFEFYKLNYKDRVVVNYQENGYYLVIFRFDEIHDPIAGWILINNILLDRDVIYSEGGN